MTVQAHSKDTTISSLTLLHDSRLDLDDLSQPARPFPAHRGQIDVRVGAPLDGFGVEIGGCTAGPESLLHQAEFGSMREEERGGEGGGSLHKSRLRFSVVAQYVAGCQLDHIAQNGRGVMQQIQPLLASFGNRPVGFNSFNPSFRRACCARQITSNAYPVLQQLLRRPKWQLVAQSVDFC